MPLVCALEILEVLSAVCYKSEKAATRMLVLAVFIQMGRKFLDAAREKGDLHLGRTRVGVVPLSFLDFVTLLALREHPHQNSTFERLLQGLYWAVDVVEVPAGAGSTLMS